MAQIEEVNFGALYQCKQLKRGWPCTQGSAFHWI